MNNEPRRRTIDSAGNIIPAPYGSSRWATPKRYTCAHGGCPNAATVVKPANAHETSTGSVGEKVVKAHNCCGAH